MASRSRTIIAISAAAVLGCQRTTYAVHTKNPADVTVSSGSLVLGPGVAKVVSSEDSRLYFERGKDGIVSAGEPLVSNDGVIDVGEEAKFEFDHGILRVHRGLLVGTRDTADALIFTTAKLEISTPKTNVSRVVEVRRPHWLVIYALSVLSAGAVACGFIMLGDHKLRPAAPWSFGLGGAFAIGAIATGLRPGADVLIFDGH